VPLWAASVVQESLTKVPGFLRQTGDVVARECAVLLGMLLRYADAVVNLSPHDEPARFIAANVFDSPAIPARPGRAMSNGRSFSLTPGPSTGSPGLGSGAPHGSSVVSSRATATRDTPAVLLQALASLLRAHADVMGGSAAFPDDLPHAAQDAFISFISSACKSGPMLEEAGVHDAPLRQGWGPPARRAFLAVLEAYACSPEAAFQIVSQLVLHAQHDDYEHLSWQEYFKMMSGLHERYIQVSAETRFGLEEGMSQTPA
jgi:hypothetical protein